MSSDVLVVGGGVVGLSVTAALLDQGMTVTSVYPPPDGALPVATLAAGAMLGAFGELSAGDDAGFEDLHFAARLEAQRMYPAWLDQVVERSGSTVHQDEGTFVVANNVGLTDRASLRLMKQRADATGEPAEFVEMEDVPGLRPNQYQAPGSCLHLPNEHSLDPEQLLGALERCAASYPTWTRVTDIVDAVEPQGKGWAVTSVTGEAFRADQVVLCAGSRSWDGLTKEVVATAGLPEMFFGKGVSCVVRNGPTVPSTIRTPNRAFACGIHVVPRSDGLLYLGATNSLGVDHELERGIQPGELHNLFDEVIHQINTDVREARIELLSVGFRPIVAHGRPVVGATALPGLSVATGTYRDGVLLAPLIGSLVADQLSAPLGLGQLGGTPARPNPFPVVTDHGNAVPCRRDDLIERGVRDIVSFLQEPRGELPYERCSPVAALRDCPLPHGCRRRRPLHARAGRDPATPP